MALLLLDQAFFALHTLLILFNMFGWAFPRTRVWHLVTFGVTTFSWFVLGAFYGWGYCLCTDWHFRIRRQMEFYDPDNTYIQLLVRHLTGIEVSQTASDVSAGVVYIAVLIATSITWWRVAHRSKSPPLSPGNQPLYQEQPASAR